MFRSDISQKPTDNLNNLSVLLLHFFEFQVSDRLFFFFRKPKRKSHFAHPKRCFVECVAPYPMKGLLALISTWNNQVLLRCLPEADDNVNNVLIFKDMLKNSAQQPKKLEKRFRAVLFPLRNRLYYQFEFKNQRCV